MEHLSEGGTQSRRRARLTKHLPLEASQALRRVSIIVAAGALCTLLAACASRDGGQGQGAEAHWGHIQDAWGLTVERVSLTAAGGVIEVRYRVMDSEKAGVALSGSVGHEHGSPDLAAVARAPLLIDEDSGFGVMESELHMTGRLVKQRQNPDLGQSYFILFTNTKSIVEEGDLVSLHLGELSMEHLRVQ